MDSHANTVWQFSMCGALKFGRGCRHELAGFVKRHESKRPLVVTDSNLLVIPAVGELISRLKSGLPTLEVFDGGVAEPSVRIADELCRHVANHRSDCVIGIGGGSNLDMAKIASVVGAHGGSPGDYFGFDMVPGRCLPMFALPTTAGTGSEVSHSAVLTDEDAGVKVSTLSPWLRPTGALVDPALTDSCPKKVTADSGIDALVHAIEAYTNRNFRQMVGVDPQARAYEGSYPFTGMLASEAIRLVGRSLVRACEQPADAAARDDMALAATLAGMAFSNSGVGIVHALEYPVGALTHCGHGEGNGLLLPHVMRYNLPVRMQEFGKIATWLGADIDHMSTEEAAATAIREVVDLQNRIGIPTRLRDLGLARSDIEVVAEKAFAIKRLMDINPQTPTVASLVAILEKAY